MSSSPKNVSEKNNAPTPLSDNAVFSSYFAAGSPPLHLPTQQQQQLSQWLGLQTHPIQPSSNPNASSTTMITQVEPTGSLMATPQTQVPLNPAAPPFIMSVPNLLMSQGSDEPTHPRSLADQGHSSSLQPSESTPVTNSTADLVK